jgi:pyruvate/oxaloacetate carboxyltransferase
MLSKSRGQILRVAATLHVLFHMDTPSDIPNEISEDALKAAVDFVDVCTQHVAHIAGRGLISEAVKELQDVQKGKQKGGGARDACGIRL